MSRTVGFVGLGQMGLPMARNLLESGHRVAGWSRSRERVEALVAAGARAAVSPADAASDADAVFTMVTDDAALEAVTLGRDGLLAGLRPGAAHVSMSTVSPEVARRLAPMHETRRAALVSAPVFGRPDMAAARKLFVAVSGAPVAVAAARPLLELLGQSVHDFGEDPGAACLVKLAGNFLMGSAIEAMAEACALAEKSGVAPDRFMAMMLDTQFACPFYRALGPIVARRDYQPKGSPLSLGLKDMSLAWQVAVAARTPMPLLQLILQRQLTAIAKGRAELDVAAFALAAAEDAGLV